MKLAAKLILIFMIGVLAIVALFSWQTISRQQAWADSQQTQLAIDLVGSIQPALDKAFHDGGTIQIQRAVEVTTRHMVGRRMRWVDQNASSDSLPVREAAVPMTMTTSREVSNLTIVGKDGSPMAYTYVPLQVGDEQIGAVEVSHPGKDRQEQFRGSLIASLISLLGVASLSGLVIYWGGVRMIGRPLDRLIHQVAEIGEGKLDQPPVVQTSDELGQLALAISDMSTRLNHQQATIRADADARLQSELRLRHADRLSTVGTLAAGVAHELGTPLNVVAGRAGLIAGGKLTAEEIVSSAATIKSEAERMTEIIRQLLDFARRTPSKPTDQSAQAIIQRTCELMESLADRANVTIEIATINDAFIHADSGQIQQVVTNILTNAIHAMPTGGRIDVSIDDADTEPPLDVVNAELGFVRIAIADQGNGMTSEQIERAFEPYFTTKDVGQGTGLGLSIAYSIVREHDGWIDIQSENGAGSTFNVYLPKSNSADPSGEPTKADS